MREMGEDELEETLKHRSRRKRTIPSLLPNLLEPPHPGKLQELGETAKGVVDEILGLRSLPKELLGRIPEAEEDFRQADKALRRTRIKGKRGP